MLRQVRRRPQQLQAFLAFGLLFVMLEHPGVSGVCWPWWTESGLLGCCQCARRNGKPIWVEEQIDMHPSTRLFRMALSLCIGAAAVPVILMLTAIALPATPLPIA